MRILAASSTLALALSTLRGVLALRVLEPADLGLWKTLMLLLPLAGWLRLSFSQGMVLRVPLLRGRGDASAALELCGVAGWIQIANGLFFGLSIFVASFIADAGWQVPLRWMALVMVAAQVHNFYRDVIICHEDSPARGRGLLLAAGTDLVFSIGLAAIWGLPGFALGTLLGLLVPAVYLIRRAPVSPHRFGLAPAAELWNAGWRVAVIDIAQTLLRYTDVAMVAWLGGPAMAGLYALSQMAAEAGMNLARVSVGEVMAPRLLRQAGQEGGLAGASEAAQAMARRLLLGLPPALLAAGLLMDPLVTAFLPRYTEGVPAARIMLWTVLFGSLQAAAQPLLAAAGRLSTPVVLSLALLPLSLVAQAAVWRTGAGLPGIAAVAVAVSAIHALACAASAIRISRQALSRRQLVPQC